MGEDCEAMFSYDGKMTLTEVAEDMIRRGFALDKGMQDYIDEQASKPLWPQLKALSDKLHGVPPKNGNNNAP